MSNYFKFLPKVFYRYGDEVDTNIANNLSVYIDIIDQVKNEISFYQTFDILDGDRPDIVSQQLYGTPDYGWTLFLLNDNLREQGWPLTEQEIEAKTERVYPHRVLITEGVIAEHFLPGRTIVGANSGVTGTILKRNLDLGQMFVEADTAFDDTEPVDVIVGDETYEVTLKSEIVEYNAVHHYENSAGDWVDIDPYAQVTTGLIPITYKDRLQQQNDELKTINIIKPGSIEGVVSQWKKLLRD